MLKNSKRSGGPQTAQGRAIASKNALKSGVFSKRILLDDESAKEFAALLDTFIEDEQPAGVVQQLLVNRLAETVWRMRRFDRFECSAYRQMLHAPIQGYEWAEHLGFGYEETLKSYQDLPFGFKDQSLAYYATLGLALVELTKQCSVSPPTMEFLRTQHPMALGGLLAQCKLEPKVFEERLIANVTNSRGDPFWITAINNTHQWIRERTAHLNAVERVDRAVDVIHDQRIRDYLMRGDYTRPVDELNRLFFRTLAELRKEQALSQAREAVVICEPRMAVIAQRDAKAIELKAQDG